MLPTVCFECGSKLNDAGWTWRITANDVRLAAGAPLLSVIFDPGWYLSRYPDAANALDADASLTALDHYFAAGSDGRPATPFFDAEWYLLTYPDAAPPQAVNGRPKFLGSRYGRYLQALTHYLTIGCFENRSPNAIFDEVWYASRYQVSINDSPYLNHYHHYLVVGAAQGFSPSPFFDEPWYRRQYPDVESAISHGLLESGFHDYLRRPLAEERDACPYFSVSWYQTKYRGERPSRRFAYFDFLLSGSRGGYNPSLYFDERWYCTEHASARSAITSGIYPSGYYHYLYEGARLDLAPNPYFQPKWYAAWYPQAARKLASGEYAHSLEHYAKEGRAQGLSPNLHFDETWYLHTQPDVQAALARGQIVSGHDHYLGEGMRENRAGSTIFDAEWYRNTYPDVQEFLDNGLAAGSYDHFCRYGRKAGYSPCADFDEAWYRKTNPDVAAGIEAGKWVDGLHHFVVEGLNHGRLPHPGIVQDKREQNVAVAALARMELQHFLCNRQKLACDPSPEPVVSILLILYNRAELTYRCLQSIARWAGVPYEVIVVDNASSDETAELLSRVHGVTVHRNDRNLHFLRAANQASALARGKYILFLNNDSELQVNAIPSAVSLFTSNPDVGAVGGKIILNNGVLQEAGSYLLPNGFSAQFGRAQLPFQSDYMHRRDVPYCSGAFLMTPSALFNEMGRFDPAFLPAYCEDADYCLRLWEKGLRVVFNPASIILHHETGSSRFRRFLYPSLLRSISIFRDRYAKYLSTVPDYGRAPVSSLDGKQFQPGYLVLVDSIPGPQDSPRLAAFIRRMLPRKLFLSIYPLEPWTGERSDLASYIPDEVEVVGEKGVDHLEAFARARAGVYQGVVLLLDSVQAGRHDLRALRHWLPHTPVFADTESYSEFQHLLVPAIP